MTSSQTQLDLAPDSTAMRTPQLLEALRGHYLKPGEPRQGAVFLTEVTAPNRVNRADAIHVGLWPSRGYTVDVHELKTSRADFRRELDSPAKADAWWAHSSTFWIVAPDVTIAPPELLPPGWGLMVPGRSRRFRVVVKAEHRDLKPTTALLAALLISMETDRESLLERQRRTLEDRHYQDMQVVRATAAQGTLPHSMRERLRHLDALEAAIGFKLSDYDFTSDEVSVKTLSAALRELVLEGKAARGVDQVLDRLAKEAEWLKKAVAQARKDLGGGAS